MSFRQGDQELLIHTEKTGRREGIQTWFNDTQFPCSSSGFKHMKAATFAFSSAMWRMVLRTGPRDDWDVGAGDFCAPRSCDVKAEGLFTCTELTLPLSLPTMSKD